MSAFDIISVPIYRSVKTKTAALGYTTVWAQIPGSPFDCRFYRQKDPFSDRTETQAGKGAIVRNQVLSLPIGSDVRQGDIARLPAGQTTAAKADWAKILNPRFYSSGVQCDVETGAAAEADLVAAAAGDGYGES